MRPGLPHDTNGSHAHCAAPEVRSQGLAPRHGSAACGGCVMHLQLEGHGVALGQTRQQCASKKCTRGQCCAHCGGSNREGNSISCANRAAHTSSTGTPPPTKHLCEHGTLPTPHGPPPVWHQAPFMRCLSC